MEGTCFGCGDDNPVGLGLSFSVEPPGVVATFQPRPEHRGPPGFLHGGLAATVLDETMAALGYLLDGMHCVTATLEVRYRRPVAIGETPLRVEAWEGRERGPDAGGRSRRRRVQGHLLLADGSVAVEAKGVFVAVRPDEPTAWRPE